jgi:hypothetical protein
LAETCDYVIVGAVLMLSGKPRDLQRYGSADFGTIELRHVT